MDETIGISEEKIGMWLKKSDRIYGPVSIMVGTYLFGPFFGLYCVSKNIEFFKHPHQGNKFFWRGFVWVTLFIVSILIIPESILGNIPDTLFPLLYMWVIYYYMNQIIWKDVENYLENGWEKHSAWTLFGVGLLAFISILLYGLFLAFIMPASIIL